MNYSVSPQLEVIMKEFEIGRYESGLQKLGDLFETTSNPKERIYIVKLYIDLGLVDDAKERLFYLEEETTFLSEIDRLKAEISYKEGNIERAIETMHDLIDYQPEVEDYVFISQLYFEDGLPEVASRYINLAIDLEDGIAYYHYLKGLYAYEVGDHKTAIYSFREAVTIEEEEPLYFLALGEAFYSIGDFDKSLENIEQVLKMYPDQEEATFLKGILLVHMGEEQEGILSLKRISSKQPDNIDILISLAFAYEKIHDHENSIKHLERVLSIDEFHHQALKTLAEIYSHQGNTVKADMYRKRALEIEPEDQNEVL